MAEQILQKTDSLAADDGEIVALAGRYYRITRYLMTLLFLVFGFFCIRDGFFRYPAENKAAVERKQNEPHPGFDIPLNRSLALVLPPLGLLTLARALYNSRGAIRLAGMTLNIPSHPPISLDSIRKIDKRLWDRKGIAYIEYEGPGGATDRFKLDDFIYERDPIDRIVGRIDAHAAEIANQEK
jgi:hypothetical protein